MTRKLARIFPVSVLSWISVSAATIGYTDSGTFSSSTPVSAFSGPNETWSFSFQVNTSPALSDVGMGGFSFAFSNFSYTLSGLPDPVTPTFIRFFSPTNGAGFLMCFNGATTATCTDGLGPGFFAGPTMYLGSTSAPTLLSGAFTFNPFYVVVNSTNYQLPATTVTATPEPATLLTLAVGLVALGCRRRQSLL